MNPEILISSKNDYYDRLFSKRGFSPHFGYSEWILSRRYNWTEIKKGLEDELPRYQYPLLVLMAISWAMERSRGKGQLIYSRVSVKNSKWRKSDQIRFDQFEKWATSKVDSFIPGFILLGDSDEQYKYFPKSTLREKAL